MWPLQMDWTRANSQHFYLSMEEIQVIMDQFHWKAILERMASEGYAPQEGGSYINPGVLTPGFTIVRFLRRLW